MARRRLRKGFTAAFGLGHVRAREAVNDPPDTLSTRMPALDAIRDLRNSRASLRPASREDPSAEPQQQAAKLSKLKALSDADKDVIASLQTKIKELYLGWEIVNN